MRVVLCDDHTLFTDALAAQLASRGHEVVATLTDPGTLGHAVLGTRPDVVLLDLSFPTGSGLDAARTLRDAGSSVRVVLCTGETLTTLTSATRPVRTALRDGTLDALVEKTADVTAIEAALLGGTGRAHDLAPRDPKAAWRLTPRETDVLAALAQGLSTTKTAERLGIAPSTVHAHVRSAMLRLDVRSRYEAVHQFVVASGQVTHPGHGAGHGSSRGSSHARATARR
ncbi:response regulator transcription factor [Nocardioides sp.]|uniref:response regulator transcription factor n=1 Tax=Nocardioides sp. TaxID=35761 RepID=UPI001A1D6228|nr:response regulator transcription factor [Nocardioides sp.]MBJ7357219.1 response regulator transcription factor [Nocardioides sp.]